MPPASFLRSNLVEILQQRVVEQPDKTAYIFLRDGESPSEQLTYRELDREARKIASYCQSILAKGERALLLYPPGLEFVAAFFGCLYAEIVAIPLYPPKRKQKSTRLLNIVRDSQATAILTTQAVKGDWQQRWQSKFMSSQLPWIATDDLHFQSQEQSRLGKIGDRLALLQYTSGSIGKPKGVMVSHSNLIHNLAMIHACFGHNRDTVGISWLPHYHDMGLIGGVLQSVYGGFVVIIMPPVAFVSKPIRWLQAMSRYKATASGGPNFAYDLCAVKITPEQIANLDLSNWQLAFTGAEPIRAETLNKFASTFACCGFKAEALNPGYGLAESTLFVSGYSPKSVPSIKWFDTQALSRNKVIEVVARSPQSRAMVSCGRSWSEQQIRIVDPQSHCVLPEKRVGEIWVEGNSVALGYWHRPQQTQETFKACLADGTGSYLRTGDLGFFWAGDLFVTGRLKDTIIIRGCNHYPQDIELTAQKSHPALRVDCGAAFSLEIGEQERLILVQEVERSQIRHLDVDRVASQVNKAIATEHQLAIQTIVFIKTGSIPKTSSGKIKRQECRNNYLAGELKIVGKWELNLDNSLNSAIATTTPSEGIDNWLKQWLAQRLSLDIRAIDNDAALTDFGLDSVVAVELAQDIEDWLKFPFNPNLLGDFSCLHTLTAYLVARKTSAEIESVPQAIDLVTEAILNPAIRPLSYLEAESTAPQAILLTGATGFLGAFLLEELLRQTEARIYCLVRATDGRAGKERIQANLTTYGLWQPIFAERIIPVVGDLSRSNLGLSREKFQALGEKIDTIYHNGALLNYVYCYQLLKPTNVSGTESILQLASSGKPKSIHYISSTAVFDCHTSTHQQPVVKESDFIASPEGMYLGYSQSKWVADKMMQTARDRGLSISIYRPSLIGGHGKTGVANGKDIIWRIIKGSLQIGYLPEINFELDLTPVDYVSQNIVALSQHREFDKQTFHLNHPQPMLWNQLLQFMRDAGYSLETISLKLWLTKLETLVRSQPTNPLYPLIPFFLNRHADNLTILELMQSHKSPQVDCQQTRQKLVSLLDANSNLPSNKALWQIYLNYFQSELMEADSAVGDDRF